VDRVECRWMLGTQGLLVSLQSALEPRLCLSQLLLVPIDAAQVVDRVECRRVLWAQRLRPGQLFLVIVEHTQAVDRVECRRMLWAQHLLVSLQGALVHLLCLVFPLSICFFLPHDACLIPLPTVLKGKCQDIISQAFHMRLVPCREGAKFVHAKKWAMADPRSHLCGFLHPDIRTLAIPYTWLYLHNCQYVVIGGTTKKAVNSCLIPLPTLFISDLKRFSLKRPIDISDKEPPDRVEKINSCDVHILPVVSRIVLALCVFADRRHVISQDTLPFKSP